MSAPYTKLETPIDQLTLVCRGCLADSGEMKNIYEWGISEDYFGITAIEATKTAGISELLCLSCEETLNTCKQFRETCQMSDRKLKASLKKKNMALKKKKLQNNVTCTLQGQKLIINIVAPKTETKIYLPCPFNCSNKYTKKSDLYSHLKKNHNVTDNFKIDLQYYCSEKNCHYHMNSKKKKYFAGRKYLNQHYTKVHKVKTFYCNDCTRCFPTESSFNAHTKTCNMVYICQMCNLSYSTNEKLMVHLIRKHPNVHQLYKNERKAEKLKLTEKLAANETNALPEAPQNLASNTQSLDPKPEAMSWQISDVESGEKIDKDNPCDSPKKSFATQIPELTRSDVTLPVWQSKPEFETKTDSTQTVFEDLLSLKSQNSEDETFFEAVSLSDIQTQTFSVEFGLSRSHKETQSCKTQSPDLSIKETQTCFCHYDSPKPNFRLFDSLSSSPASSNLTSTETQTGDHRFSVKSDVLLSFNSTETQTCFDDSSNDSM